MEGFTVVERLSNELKCYDLISFIVPAWLILVLCKDSIDDIPCTAIKVSHQSI